VIAPSDQLRGRLEVFGPAPVLVDANRTLHMREISVQHRPKYIALDLLAEAAPHCLEFPRTIPRIAHLHQHVDDAGRRCDMYPGMLGEDIGEQRRAASWQSSEEI